MQVTVEGKYVVSSRKIKELVNFETKVNVPDGLTENEIKSLLAKSKESPLAKKLREEDKQFYALSKFRLLDFSKTLPADEVVDTPESLGINKKAEKKPSGKITANQEFDDISDALSDKPKKKAPAKVADGKKG